MGRAGERGILMDPGAAPAAGPAAAGIEPAVALVRPRTDPVTTGPRRPRPAEPHEERHYADSFDGEVLTAKVGHPFVSLTAEHRSIVALTGNGYLLINEAAQTDRAVFYVRQVASQQGYLIEEALLVQPATLISLYNRYETRVADSIEFAYRDDDELSSEARQIFDRFLAHAARLRASDLLISVRSGMTVLELRVDSLVKVLDTVTEQMGHQLMQVAYNGSDSQSGSGLNRKLHQQARIAALDVAAAAKGEAGGDAVRKKKILLPRGVQAARLEFSPLVDDGHYLALRLLYREGSSGLADIDGLGYASVHVRAIRAMRWLPQGINLVVGVTGSGKSTTLQITLKALMRERDNTVNVITVEDPPEYTIPGAKQIPVNAEGQDRAAAMNAAIASMLRSAPDIIMIGEIRDRASADLAVTASMTGHQVWSTVHAISPLRALERLIDAGVDRARILDPDVVTGLVGQRLVPKVCPSCSMSWAEGIRSGRFTEVPAFVPQLQELFRPDLLERVRVRDARGCRQSRDCQSGYVGRTVVAEVVEPNDELMRLYREGSVADAERHFLSETGGMGGIRMLEHGVAKMFAGVVDPLDPLAPDRAGPAVRPGPPAARPAVRRAGGVPRAGGAGRLRGMPVPARRQPAVMRSRLPVAAPPPVVAPGRARRPPPGPVLPPAGAGAGLQAPDQRDPRIVLGRRHRQRPAPERPDGPAARARPCPPAGRRQPGRGARGLGAAAPPDADPGRRARQRPGGRASPGRVLRALDGRHQEDGGRRHRLVAVHRGPRRRGPVRPGRELSRPAVRPHAAARGVGRPAPPAGGSPDLREQLHLPGEHGVPGRAARARGVLAAALVLAGPLAVRGPRAVPHLPHDAGRGVPARAVRPDQFRGRGRERPPDAAPDRVAVAPLQDRRDHSAPSARATWNPSGMRSGSPTPGFPDRALNRDLRQVMQMPDSQDEVRLVVESWIGDSLARIRSTSTRLRDSGSGLVVAIVGFVGLAAMQIPEQVQASFR